MDNAPWYVLALDADMKTELIAPAGGFLLKSLAESVGRILVEEKRYVAFQVKQPMMPPYA